MSNACTHLKQHFIRISSTTRQSVDDGPVEASRLRVQSHHHRSFREQSVLISPWVGPHQGQRHDAPLAEHVTVLLLLVYVVNFVFTLGW